MPEIVKILIASIIGGLVSAVPVASIDHYKIEQNKQAITTFSTEHKARLTAIESHAAAETKAVELRVSSRFDSLDSRVRTIETLTAADIREIKTILIYLQKEESRHGN